MVIYERPSVGLITPSFTWRQPRCLVSPQRAKHAGVEAAFSQYLVKTGQVEPEFSRLYQQARRQREEADYAEDLVIDETIAKQILTDAERFVERIERYLREQEAL
jgi:uncharacterized protein (UPF0332 family)